MPEGVGAGLAAGTDGVATDPGAGVPSSQEAIAEPNKTADAVPAGTQGEGSAPAKTIPEADFRAYQSKMDQKLAQLQREAEQRELQALTVIDQLTRQLDALQLAGAPPEVVQAKQAERQLAVEQFKLAKEREKLQAERDSMVPVLKEAAIQKLSTQYGCPRAELEGFDNYPAMEAHAKAYKKFARQAELDKRIKNKVDDQEGSSATSSVDISNIKDPKTLLSMGFANLKKR